MSAFPRHGAIRAEKFVRILGVNTHSAFGGTVYGENPLFLAELVGSDGLDIRIVRDRIGPGSDSQRAFFAAIAPGTKIHSSIGVYNTSDLAFVQAVRDEIKQFYGDQMRSVGGVNEPNDSPKNASWAQTTFTQQQWIRDVFKADPDTASIPIIGPALKQQEDTLEQDFIDLGTTGIVNLVDYGDVHVYQSGSFPDYNLDKNLAWAESAYPGLECACTEGGYNTGITTTSGGNPVTLTAHAIYLLRLHAEMFLRDVPEFFIYEFLNDPPKTEWEANFGLYECPSITDTSTWRPKPAYTALKRWIKLLGDRGPMFTPGALHYALTGGGPECKSILLQKRDGRFFLLVWRNIKVESPGRPPVALPVTPVDAKLELMSAKKVKVHKPSSSDVPVKSYTNSSVITVPLDAEMHVLEIG